MKTRTAARKFLPGALSTLFLCRLSLAQTAPDQAAPDFTLEVERSDSALACPDVAWFRARIATHSASSAGSGQAGNFKVTLELSGDTWRARIQRWDQGRESLPAAERVLEDRSTACAPLADAVSVTIAILAEDLAVREVAPIPSQKPKPAQPAPPLASKPMPVVQTEPGVRVWVGAGGGATVAWISPVAPVLGLGVALDSKYFRQAVRVTLTTEQNFDLYPGRVVVQAWLASMLSCLRLTRGDTGAALCAVFDAGLLSGRTEGFGESTPSTQSYEAVGLELQPTWELAERVRVSASLAGLVPFTRESFSVTGRGFAYVPPSVNGRALMFIEVGVF